MSKRTPQQTALESVLTERKKQDLKWGIRDHDMPSWLVILAEEVGELSGEILTDKFTGQSSETLRTEAVQCAAAARIYRSK